jgi:hypothetical protein
MTTDPLPAMPGSNGVRGIWPVCRQREGQGVRCVTA